MLATLLNEDLIHGYLKQIGFLWPGEQVVDVGPAGQGNMNLTWRVTTGRRTFILKQSPPWVAKYPHIPAPPERALTESVFYQRAGRSKQLSSRIPALLKVDPEANTLILEDLGSAPSCTDLYRGKRTKMEEIHQLVHFLVELHGGDFGPEIDNPEMRKLNHYHIFVLPLAAENPLVLDDLCPGLARIGHRLSARAALLRATHALGQRYLARSGTSLLHGDYYPGSWLRTPGGLKVIDPEFCFHGPPEFDVGVLLGHLVLSGQPKSHLDRVLAEYGRLDQDLARAFAGIEIIRRLLGVAQLPLLATLRQRDSMLQRAESWVVAYGA